MELPETLLTRISMVVQLADDPNVVIAKMDATANDVPPQYEVSGWVCSPATLSSG